MKFSIYLNRRVFVMNIELITKTCLYNADPLKLHLFMGFTGVYIVVSYFCSKTYIAVLTSTQKSMFEQKYEKCQNFYLIFFFFLGGGEIFSVFK